MPAPNQWLFWALLSAVFAALTAIFGKVGLQTIDSDYATWLRTLIISVVLGCIVWVTGKWRNPSEIPARALTFITLSALATGASWFCYYRALKVGEASRVTPIDKLSVVLVAIFAVTFLGERPSPQGWLGIVMIGCGAILVAWK